MLFGGPLYNLMIGSEVYVVYNRMVKKSYLLGIQSPVMSILTTIPGLPAYPAVIDVINGAITSYGRIVEQVNAFDVNSWLAEKADDRYGINDKFDKMMNKLKPVTDAINKTSKITGVIPFKAYADNMLDFVFNLIDFKALGFIIGRDLSGIRIEDFKSAFTSNVVVAIKSGNSVIKQTLPTSRVFLTKTDAEAYAGSGNKCVICRQTFMRSSDVPSDMVCPRCYGYVSDLFNPSEVAGDSVKFGAFQFKVKRNLDVKRLSGENTDDFIKRAMQVLLDKYGDDINDGKYHISANTVDDDTVNIKYTIDQYKTINSFSTYYRTYKRENVIKSVYGKYLDFIDGNFDPNDVKLVTSGKVIVDQIMTLTSNSGGLVVIIPAISTDVYTVLHGVVKTNDMKLIKNILNITMVHTNLFTQHEPVNVISGDELRSQLGATNSDGEYEMLFSVKVLKSQLKNGGNVFSISLSFIDETEDIVISEAILCSDINSGRVGEPWLEISTDLPYLKLSGGVNDYHVTINTYRDRNKIQTYDKNCDNTNKIYLNDVKFDKTTNDVYTLDIGVKNKNTSQYTHMTYAAYNPLLKPKIFKIETEFAERAIDKLKNVDKNLSEKRYFIDDEVHDFILKVNSDRSFRLIGAFVVIRCAKNNDNFVIERYYPIKEMVYSYMGETVYGELPISFDKSELKFSGKYIFTIAPIIETMYGDLSTPAPSIDTAMVKDKLMRRSVGTWFISDSYNILDINLYNDNNGDVNTLVTLNIDKKEIYDNLKQYGIKIKQNWLYLSSSKYETKVTEYVDSVFGSLKDMLLGIEIDGVRCKNVNINDDVVTVNIEYQNIENTNKTSDNNGVYVKFHHIYNNGLFNNVLADIITKKYPKLRLVPKKQYVIDKRSKSIVLDYTIKVINSTAINMHVGDDVWVTTRLGKSPVNVINRGILTSIEYDSSSTGKMVGSNWASIEGELLTGGVDAKVLINPVPSISAYQPPYIPTVPLISVVVNRDNVYATYDEAKRNSLWFFCPRCLEFKRPKSDKKAMKMIEFTKKFVTDTRNDLDDYAKKVSMIDQIEDVLKKYKKKSSDLLYTQSKVGKSNGSIYSTSYDSGYSESLNGHSILGSEYDEEYENKIRPKRPPKKNSSGGDSGITALRKKAYDTTNHFKPSGLRKKITKKTDDSIDWSKEKIETSVKYDAIKKKGEQYKTKIKDAINNDIGKICSKLEVDSFDFNALVRAADMPGDIKLCSSCQNKIAEIFGDIVKWLRDLFLSGIVDIDFVITYFIDVLFYNDTTDFVKFDFKMPRTGVERDMLRKDITELLLEF